MYKILQLTNYEANIIDDIIRLYKLPIEIIQSEDTIESDRFQDTETQEEYDLVNGLYEILEAINCDDRELFKNNFTKSEQKSFESICLELGIDCSHERIEALESSANKNRIEIMLPDKNYKLVAEKDNSLPNMEEIIVTVCDANDNSYVQDIVRVGPRVINYLIDDTVLCENSLDVYNYDDEYDEDYTRKKVVNIYKGGK